MPNKPSFLYGAGFRSLTRETPDPVALKVEGRLPSWLEGTLLRTGPSKFEVGNRTYNHWFDGLAMLHRFAFAGGAVSYANRFLKSKAFCAAEATGKIAFGEFATDPCWTLFGRVAAIFNPKLTDNCCVNVADYARSAVAFTETSIPVRFSPDTIQTLGVFGYDLPLTGQISTAHPHYDAKRARYYNYVADLGFKSVYRLISVGDDGAQRQVGEIAVERPSYMHSFGMSEDHLILSEFPLVVNPLDLRVSGKPFIRNYRWVPERGLRFHVVEKDSGRLLRSVTADAVFGFHHVNAFADGDDVLVDFIAHPDARVIDQLYLARLRAGAPVIATGTLMRFRIPLKSDASVTRTVLVEAPIELPRINYETKAGKRYRYLWATGTKVEGDFLDCAVKIDLETGAVMTWYVAGLYPGEPVFVPSPKAQAEDEGVLLSVVLDTGKDSSFLLVLDAATLEELARAEAPHAIPFHFHGNYFRGAPATEPPSAAR
jgi:carotenoid cleavage dioxygenase-like enzyme